MRTMHSKHTPSPIVGQHDAAYMSNHTAGASLLLPCAPCVPSLQDLPPATLVAPLSPRAEPYFLQSPCGVRMADLSAIPLLRPRETGIFIVLLRRAPYPPPSDPVSQHRALIVSSSLDQGSPVERISSSLALCHHFGFGSGQSSGPVFGRGLFFGLAEPLSAWFIFLQATSNQFGLTVCRC